MDARKLETTRDTALKYVQRCTPACPSSTSCRFRRARRKLREGGKPCTHAPAWQTRFVLKVPRIYGSSLYTCASGTVAPRDLMQAANDTALIELLIDCGTWCQADWRALIEEASKAERPGPLNGRPRQSVAKNRSRSDGRRSMRLTERKRILIDLRRALYTGATSASPPAKNSLETDKENTYEVCGTTTPKRGCVNGRSAYAASRLERRIYTTQSDTPGNPRNWPGVAWASCP